VTRTKSGRDTSEHKACNDCKAQMVEKGQSCPWCRDEVRPQHWPCERESACCVYVRGVRA
jgi:hypothetical protein